MNLVALFSSILFTLFGLYTCAVLPLPPSSSLERLDGTGSDVGQEQIGSSSMISEKKLDDSLDDHAGDHDKDQKVKPRKGVVLPDDEGGKVSTEVHTNRNSSIDRASTTITKDSDSITNKTSETSSAATKSKDKVTNSSDASSSIAPDKYSSSDRYSPSDSKSTRIDTSSSIVSESKSKNSSTASDLSKTSSSASKSSSSKSVSSESTSSSKSSSINKKPLVTYSVEDDPTLLNVPRVRQFITPLTPLNVQAEGADSAYLPPPSDDFVHDRMQSKREMYIFPLVVLIFLVPMVLGVGIIILRRVRDYWSTRHYSRMDFLVDGMYNT